MWDPSYATQVPYKENGPSLTAVKSQNIDILTQRLVLQQTAVT